MTEQRLIDLETKISHQEAAIDALQQAVVDQQKAVSILEKILGRLGKTMEGLIENGSERGLTNEPPPHY